ncbi:MAG: hypothetical protein J5755_00580, partial [Clostridia bacterium]|nr:hypothetical protein [Clostridia bacterium]
GGGEDNPPQGHTHSLVQVPRVEPTATSDGHLAYWTCSGCNKYFSDEGGRNEITNLAAWLQGDGKLAATGGGDNPPQGHTHNMVETRRVDATETQDGHLAYWFCAGCNKYFSDAEGRNEIVNLNSWLAGAGRLPATGGQTSDGPVRVVAEYIGGVKRVGDTLLPSEIQVMAYYANGNFVLVDDFELCYFDNETAGEVEVEIDVTIDGTNWCPSVTITVLPAEGEDPNEFVTIREEYIGSAVTHGIVSFFEGGLMVEYAYSGRNALTLQGTEEVDRLVAIKGNLGYFKDVLTGYSEYIEFGQTTYTVYPYNSNIGDYEREGMEVSYDMIEQGMKRDDAIMYMLFGLGTQEMLSTDWANSSDVWTSCAIRYGRRGVDICLFTKEAIALTFGAESRACDRYYFAEDVTEAHEHTNGHYITIDRATGMMVEWHRDSDPIETKMFSTNFTLTLFEHIGFNPGDANDDTTVIASYPYVTNDNIVTRLIARGVQGTFRATRDQSRNDPATSGEEVSFHVYGDLYAYAGLVDGQPVVGYIDASADDYYVRYYEIADGWAASKCYYSDYYAGGADFSSKSVLESELLSMLYRCLVLDERAAHISVMTKTREQFLGRTVDKFEVTKNYETFVIRVDVETGVCIYYTDVYEAQAGTTLTY